MGLQWLGLHKRPDYGFEDACFRHDFGFKNYHKQGRLCRGARKSLDWRLFRDMNNFCKKKYSRWYQSAKRWGCKTAATTYYTAAAGWWTDYSKGCWMLIWAGAQHTSVAGFEVAFDDLWIMSGWSIFWGGDCKWWLMEFLYVLDNIAHEV